MADTQDLLTGFYFSVTVGSEKNLAFHEVNGLTKTLHTEDVVSGGENRFKYKLPSQSTFENLVLKRGVVLTSSSLITWCQATLDNGLAQSIKPQNVVVNLMNNKGTAIQTWTFVSAYPVKWSASELNSEKNALFIETIELAFQYFNVEARA